MKLYYSPTSPYSRKVRIVAAEKELPVENILANPYEENADLVATNPLGAVPTFITDNGTPLFDSPVICAYLDSLKPSPKLIPDDDTRWTVLRSEALTDGILDAAFLMVMESRRPEVEQSDYWKKRRVAAINRSLDAIEADFTHFEGDLTIAQIGLASAFGYLDFRLSEIEWRKDRHKSTAWFDTFSKRPSMTETVPEA
ncbi:MAG: glutathione S-transferase N-terminal domain-containing protein [Methyloligellaceae bacterium]